MEECTYRTRFIKERRFFLFFTLLSISVPLLSVIDIFRPDIEEFDSWFQRSGSIMVVFALLAEIRAYQMFDVFKPAGIVFNNYEETEKKYSYQVKWYNLIAYLLISIGTIIWGYGDLLVNYA